jgi:hypothetical protein
VKQGRRFHRGGIVACIAASITSWTPCHAAARSRLTSRRDAGTLRGFVPPAPQEATMTTIALADLATAVGPTVRSVR